MTESDHAIIVYEQKSNQNANEFLKTNYNKCKTQKIWKSKLYQIKCFIGKKEFYFKKDKKIQNLTLAWSVNLSFKFCYLFILCYSNIYSKLSYRNLNYEYEINLLFKFVLKYLLYFLKLKYKFKTLYQK